MESFDGLEANSSVLDNATAANESGSDIEALLRSVLGARHRSYTESIVLTLAYSIIFFTGTVGNAFTCFVIVKNSYMHTATNYYLFSLAISDVLTLILGLPPELYTIWEAYPWRFGEPYCLLKTFLTEMTSSASILTITAFTVERYFAICHPIRSQTMSSLSRAIKIIIAIWISACLAALPYPIHTRTYYYLNDPATKEPIADSYICNIPVNWMPMMTYVFQASTFVLFVLPMCIITGLYVVIGLTLRRSSLARQTSTAYATQSQSRRAVLKMLVAVVVAFFISWAPFYAQRLMTVYIKEDQWTATLLEIQSLLFYTSGVLYFVSSTVNPILYNLMSKKYRQASKETLCRCCFGSTNNSSRNRMGSPEHSSAANMQAQRKSHATRFHRSPIIKKHDSAAVENSHLVPHSTTLTTLDDAKDQHSPRLLYSSHKDNGYPDSVQF